MNSSSQSVLQKGADAMSIITACWFKTDRGVNINWQQTQYSQRIPDCHEGWIDVLFSKNKGASLKTNIQNKTNQPTKKLTTKTNLLKYLNGMENMQKRVPRCLWLHIVYTSQSQVGFHMALCYCCFGQSLIQVFRLTPGTVDLSITGFVCRGLFCLCRRSHPFCWV